MYIGIVFYNVPIRNEPFCLQHRSAKGEMAKVEKHERPKAKMLRRHFFCSRSYLHDVSMFGSYGEPVFKHPYPIHSVITSRSSPHRLTQ